MKYVKMLGLAAVAAMALMAFVGAGSASADELCKNATKKEVACEQVNALTSESEGITKLTTTFKTVECKKSAVSGSVSSQGAGKAISGSITTLDFTECNCEVVVLKNGTLSATNIAETDNGTVTSNGAEVTVFCEKTILGNIHCIYSTSNTHLGVLTGGSTAILHAEEAEIPKLTTSAACAEKSKWDATYKVTSPDSLYVYKS